MLRFQKTLDASLVLKSKRCKNKSATLTDRYLLSEHAYSSIFQVEFRDSLRWNIPLTDSGLSVVPGRFLLFQNILILFHWFPGFKTRVCVRVCSCLLCKPCSHHQKESLGMNREKRGSICRPLLFLSSCFRLLRISTSAESAGNRLVQYYYHQTLLLKWGVHISQSCPDVTETTEPSNLSVELANLFGPFF